MSDKLIFGELQIGDKFIIFPIDGDDGRGGYSAVHHIFEKTQKRYSMNGSYLNAKRVSTEMLSGFPDGMYVLLVG